jgi:ariadne-1
VEARDAQTKSRQQLERYLHYFNRYANHEQSARLANDYYSRTERKMVRNGFIVILNISSLP